MSNPKKLYYSVDMVGNEIQNFIINPMTTSARTVLGGSLSTTDKGYVVYDINILDLFLWNGTSWIQSGTISSETDPIFIAWLATNPIPTTPDLQQVTDIGDVTTKDITVGGLQSNGDVFIGKPGGGAGLYINDGATYSVRIQAGNISLSSKIIDLPNSTGTLAMSVNGVAADINGNISLTLPDVSGFVPYTGAQYNVDLGIYSLSAAYGIFTSGSGASGQSLQVSGNSSSYAAAIIQNNGIKDSLQTYNYGGGYAASFINTSSNKSPVYIWNQSTGNLLEGYNTNSIPSNGTLVFKVNNIGDVIASSFIMRGGTSSQFLKADGSIDSSVYLTTTSAASAYEPIITSGTTSQYWRGDKTWQTLPIYTLSGLGGVPTTRTITINGTLYDLSANRTWTVGDLLSSGSYANPSWITSLAYSKLTGAPTLGTWSGINYPTWVSGTPFIKMTASGTFTLDNNTYLTGNQSISFTASGDVTGSAIGTTTLTPSLTLATVNSNTGSFGSSSTIPIITVNAKGLVIAVSTVAVPIQINSLILNTSGTIHATPITFTNTAGAWSGTLYLINQSANTVFAGPTTGGTATPTFRALVTSDIPSLSSLYLPLIGGDLTGTAGIGYHGFIPQSSTPSAPSTGFRLFANSTGKFAWVGTNGFVRTFDGTGNFADRVYTLPDRNITLDNITSGITTTDLTTGSILFASGGVITQNNSKLFWDNTNNRLGLGTTSPSGLLTLGGNISANAWGTIGLNFILNPATYTDTNSSTNSVSISNISLTSNIATVTTATAHGFTVGQTVILSSVSVSGQVFNGMFTLTAASGTTFSFARTNVNITSTAATGTAKTVIPTTYFNTLGSPTLSTTNNGVAYQDIANVYIGAPIVGTNTPTFTNTYALNLGGDLGLTYNATTGRKITVLTSYTPNDGSPLTIQGGNTNNQAGVNGNLYLYGGAGSSSSGPGKVYIGNATTTGVVYVQGICDFTQGGTTLKIPLTINTSALTFTVDDTVGFPALRLTYAGTRQAQFLGATSYYFDNKIIANNIIRLKGYTYSTLPAGTQGDTAFITDSNTNTYGVDAAGGGSTIAKVWYNGTKWIIG